MHIRTSNRVLLVRHSYSGLAHPNRRTGQYGLARWYKKLTRKHGRRQLQSEVKPPLVLPKYSLNNGADRSNMAIDYQK